MVTENKGGFFSKTPIKPIKADIGSAATLATSATITGITQSILPQGVAYNSLNDTTVGYSSAGSSSVSTFTNDTLCKYEKRISDLSSLNLDLTNKVLELQVKLAKGNAPLIDAEARLQLLRDALIKTNVKNDGLLYASILKTEWEAVLEALALSLHENVALDKILQKTVANTLKKEIKFLNLDFEKAELKAAINKQLSTYAKETKSAKTSYDQFKYQLKPSVFECPDDKDSDLF